MGKKIVESLAEIRGIKFQPQLSDQRRQEMSVALKLLENVKSDIYVLNEQLSTTDKAVDRLLHDVEQENFGTVEGYKTLKCIQELRRERRRVKSEIDSLNMVYDQAKLNMNPLQASLRRAIGRLYGYETYVGVNTKRVEIELTDSENNC